MGCGLCKSAINDGSSRGVSSLPPIGKLFTVAEEKSELEESGQMKELESRIQTLVSAMERITARVETMDGQTATKSS